MKPLSVTELAEDLYKATVPCIEDFRDSHPDKKFVGFAAEVLAEEYYFQISAEAEDSYERSTKKRSYSKKPYLLPKDIKSNCQEWQFFDFGVNCKKWEKKWQPMQKRIQDSLNDVNKIPAKERDKAWALLRGVFWDAAVEAFKRLVDSDVVRSLPKGSCFVTFIYEHHDVF